jgi:hypothetical protein
MRTGANAVLFEDFVHDDRCLSPQCFKTKVDRHIALQKQNDPALVQVTRAYHSSSKGDEPILTRAEFSIIATADPSENGGQSDPAPCARATRAIVVEGPGKRGEVIQVCADPECEIHGKPNYKAEKEAIDRQREEDWNRQQEQRRTTAEKNRRLFDAVLAKVPRCLSKADFEMLVIATIDRVELEHLDAVCEWYRFDTDEVRDGESLQAQLRAKARVATEPELTRMLVGLTLLPSGNSCEELSPDDPLAGAARRYGVNSRNNKPTKQRKGKTTPVTKVNGKTPGKRTAKREGAA